MRMAMFGQADTMGMVNLDWVTSTMSHQQKFKTFPKYAVFLQDITTLCCWMRTAKSGHAGKTNTVNLEGQQKKIRMQMLGKLNHLFDSNQFQQETSIQCFWMLKAEFGDVDTTIMHHWLFLTPIVSQAWRYGEEMQEESQHIYNPHMVSKVQEISNCAFVSSCESHHLVVDTEGQVWVWGRNNSGQLGLDNKNYECLPVLNESLPSIRMFHRTKSARNSYNI